MITNQLLYQLSYTGETVGANHGSRRVYLSRPTVEGSMQLLSTHTHSGGAIRDRTVDLLRARQSLSQLSYSPKMYWRTVVPFFNAPTSHQSGSP